MLCTGTFETHVGVLFKGNHFRHYVVPRDSDDINTMVAKGREFMQRLTHNNPPPIDEGASTLAALKHMNPSIDPDETVMVSKEIADAYRAAVADLSDAKARKRAAESRLRYLMGSAARAVDEDGLALASRSIFERQGTTVDQLRSA
jgi:hypothetical protein